MARTKIKKSNQLTLSDRLSRLTYLQACKLLGPEGAKLLRQSVPLDELDVKRDIYLGGDLFRLTLPCDGSDGKPVIATITTRADAPSRLVLNCSECQGMCAHLGAAVSLILEEKTLLGLAELPDLESPLELLSEKALLHRALWERAERARTEKFRLQSSDPKRPWTDYTVASAQTGKTYRVALRGLERGECFCSCPDFRTNTLGTCKHILYALGRVKKQFPEEIKRPFRNRDAFVHIHYGEELSLHLKLPDKASPELVSAAGKLADGPIDDVRKLMACLTKMERMGHGVTVYPDAEAMIEKRLFQQRMAALAAEIRRDPAGHPLRKELLQAELLPYQLDGIAFAAGAGRAILADDMGLGKTIQGVGVAELLAREAEIRKVLVVCPASLKSQWRSEIHRFSRRDVQLVMGNAAERGRQYSNECFFTVCNYEQVLRDILAIERVGWDLIILDEGQRIKNWKAKTSNIIKGLKSTFALVLSGTPLENRLDDLYSVIQFVDDRHLPPAFRFFHRHRIVDERGKVLGYRNLDQLRERLKPVLLRRTRESVLQQLPPRTTEVVRITPTEEQLVMHGEHMRVVQMIARKKFISEMDLLRMQKSLLMARMSANGTVLVNKTPPNYSSKLQRLEEMFDELFADDQCKAVLFSEWTSMLNLIEPMLKRRKLKFVRLDGSTPQAKRQQIVQAFRDDPSCRLFLTSNAGSTGLNLQAANTVINVDLPWNPAVLEQRIGRAHRMGQKRPVQVYVLVTEQTIEENLLATLSAKHDLALAALDPDSDVSQVDLVSGIEELRRRLEVLLGAKPEAPRDMSLAEEVRRQEEATQQRRQRVAAAGGQLLGAVFDFLGELVDENGRQTPSEAVVAPVRQRLAQCAEDDPDGGVKLTFSLPDRQALDRMAQTLARLLLPAGEPRGDVE